MSNNIFNVSCTNWEWEQEVSVNQEGYQKLFQNTWKLQLEWGGKTVGLEGWEPIANTLLHLSYHFKKLNGKSIVLAWAVLKEIRMI